MQVRSNRSRNSTTSETENAEFSQISTIISTKMKTSQEEINDQPIQPKSDNGDKSCTQFIQPETQDDCAFDGAMFTLIPITDAAHYLSILLEGHLVDSSRVVTANGTTLTQLQEISRCGFTLALGESMRGAAQILSQKFSIPYEVFGELTGLEATDKFLQRLADISGIRVSEKYRRQRCQLQRVLLDTHFYFGGKRVSLALEPDLLWSTVYFLRSLGVQIHAAVTSTRSPLLEKLPITSVTIGDLEDFEQLAVGSDLLIGNSHVSAIAKRLNIPLCRQGIPIFDRLGNSLSIDIHTGLKPR